MLEPHPYLRRVRDLLRETEPKRSAWFASDSWADEHAEALRLELLKSTYRMEESAHPALHGAARRALESLELDLPVTFYQGDDDGGMNAGLCFLPGEAHIVLRGRILSTLGEAELLALVAHELAHHALWTADGGSLRVANEVLESVAAHPGASPSHVSTALRARRYAEIVADRGSLIACGDPKPTIACLVKVQTGLAEVDPDAYVRQADELFAKGALASRGVTHPETFIRARALSLWQARGVDAEPEIAAMVQGPTTMDTLDLLEQIELTATTRSLVRRLLAPRWFRTESTLAHGRAFFPDADLITPSTTAPQQLDPSVAEYLAYVLLDFAVVDEALGSVGIAHALQEGEAMGLGAAFEKAARDELKMTKRAFEDLRRETKGLLERAAAQEPS